MRRDVDGQPLDVGAPEMAGANRWRAWGGCWSCRARRADGSPQIPCGCSAPSAPIPHAVLDPWEASWATWCAFARRERWALALRDEPPPPARPPADPEAVRPGTARQDGTQTGYPYAVPRDPEAVLPGAFDGRWGAPAAPPAAAPHVHTFGLVCGSCQVPYCACGVHQRRPPPDRLCAKHARVPDASSWTPPRAERCLGGCGVAAAYLSPDSVGSSWCSKHWSLVPQEMRVELDRAQDQDAYAVAVAAARTAAAAAERKRWPARGAR